MNEQERMRRRARSVLWALKGLEDGVATTKRLLATNRHAQAEARFNLTVQRLVRYDGAGYLSESAYKRTLKALEQLQVEIATAETTETTDTEVSK